MKKLLLATALAGLVFGYEGCGANKQEALNNLAQSIYVEVSNNFQKESTYSKNSLFDFFSKSVKAKSSQSSKVVLKNVKFIKKGNLICAEIDKQNLLESAIAAKKELLNFNISALPKDFKLKYNLAKSLKNKIFFVKAVLGDKLTDKELKKLNYLQKQLDDILNQSEVVFDVNIPNAKITISGSDKQITPSKPVILTPGSYSYEIKVAGKCPVSGSFEVKKGEIKNIKVNLGDYPQITIKSNVNAIAKVNNKLVPINSPFTIHKCEGAAIYEVTYDGDKENGSINLKPNLKKVVEVNFLTKEEKEALNKSKSTYEKAKGIEISYGYGISNHPEWDKEKRITVRGFKNFGIYQLGIGLTAGTQEDFTAKAMNEAELFGSFRIQLPEWNNTPLRIGTFLFVPYIGVDGGWDFYQFFRQGFDTQYWRGSNITTILRGNVGFNIMFHRQLGVDFKYSHDFLEKEDNIFSTGLIMQF